MPQMSTTVPSKTPAPGRYEYQVVDANGTVRKGTLDADSESAVVARLVKQGYTPLSITAKPNTGLNREIKLPQRIGLKDVALMSRQAATMIGAGLSLLRVLSILAEQTRNRALADALRQVRNDVETGSAFSEALAQHPRAFPPLMVNMVRAGEVGGFLDRALDRVATTFEAEVALRGKARAALTYPLVVLVIALLLVVGMLLFIVPTFATLYDDLGGTLPLPTRIMVWLSGVMKWLAPIAAVAVVVAFIAYQRAKHTDRVREIVDPLKLKIPVFGPLFRKVYLARMTRNLASMLSAGVPMLQALDVVADTTGSTVVAHALTDVRESVRGGESLATPMGRHAIFPPMTVQMVAVGEDSGQLDEMMDKVADFYDDEVETTTQQLTTLIEPIMILILGAVVGSILISLYLPIFKIFDLVRA
jgi:type IV pilus assembly protein PilC